MVFNGLQWLKGIQYFFIFVLHPTYGIIGKIHIKIESCGGETPKFIKFLGIQKSCVINIIKYPCHLFDLKYIRIFRIYLLCSLRYFFVSSTVYLTQHILFISELDTTIQHKFGYNFVWIRFVAILFNSIL